MITTGASTAGWADLERELDCWGASRRVTTLWWRDDDAAEPTVALDRLIALADGVPLALAVIPGRAQAALARRLADAAGCAVLQHGWMHANHAPPDEKKAELGAHRPPERVVAELTLGWQRLAGLFGRTALPILAPPWNRMAATLVPALRRAGLRGLSTIGPRAAANPAPGLVQVNAHADLVAWPGRGFVGAPLALGRIRDHLAARRRGAVDAAEPTGILTHHLVQDRETERFLARLFAMTRAHRAVRWLDAAQAFAQP